MTYAWQVFNQSYCVLPRICSDTKTWTKQKCQQVHAYAKENNKEADFDTLLFLKHSSDRLRSIRLLNINYFELINLRKSFVYCRITYKYKCMVGYRSLGLDHCPYGKFTISCLYGKYSYFEVQIMINMLLALSHMLKLYLP